MNSEINIKFEIDTTTLRLLVILAALIALILVGSRSVGAQEVADTIRINTRVVFMDALVKDTRFLVTADRSERREDRVGQHIPRGDVSICCRHTARGYDRSSR